MQRHVKDKYVQQSVQEQYRARSAYKLLEIQRKHRILRPGMAVVECGAAPGAWTQVATHIVGTGGTVVGCDLLHMEPVPGAVLLQGRDFTHTDTQTDIRTQLHGRPIGCVLSDMAPNNPGNASFNHDITTNLVYSVLKFSVLTADKDSNLLVKMFSGRNLEKLLTDLAKFYTTVKIVKPGSSRKESPEIFVLAEKLKPRKE